MSDSAFREAARQLPTVPPPPPWSPLVTCEHGGRDVPADWRHLFTDCEELLASHRGWDPGSLPLAESLAAALDAPLIASTVTRLLVDLNRSPHHRALLSERSRGLDRRQRERLLERWYYPHRRRVEEAVARKVAGGGRVLHLAVHTFTPVLDGEVRRTDIGLLYDPSRQSERSFCRRLQEVLEQARPDLRVHCNRPYLGKADGLTTALRRRFAEDRYLGIELEVNQRFPQGNPEAWLRLAAELGRLLAGLLAPAAGAPEGRRPG